jgi:hypothetical protein
MHQYAPKNIAEKAPKGIEYELKRLYYDIAGTAYRPAIAALTTLVPVTTTLKGAWLAAGKGAGGRASPRVLRLSRINSADSDVPADAKLNDVGVK